MNFLEINNEMSSLLISPKPRKSSMDMIQVGIQNVSKTGRKCVFLGLCGGPSSGKSTIANYYQAKIPYSVVIAEKDFYKALQRKRRKLSVVDEPLIGDQDGYSPERKVVLTEMSNPLSFDHNHLLGVLEKISRGEKVKIPYYDPETDEVFKDRTEIDPSKLRVIILEGTFIFYNPKIRDILDLKIFAEVDDDIRLSRLILKENKYLKNNPKAIKTFLAIYKKYLKPSYDDFVESYKCYATMIVPNYAIDSKGDIFDDSSV
ncbi:MAG: hypothetical protein MJ252_17655 [archaeon]|nr:hypothetical protein [archaeon]